MAAVVAGQRTVPASGGRRGVGMQGSGWEEWGKRDTDWQHLMAKVTLAFIFRALVSFLNRSQAATTAVEVAQGECPP